MAKTIKLRGSLKATRQAAIAAILSPEPVLIRNAPNVFNISEILEYLGVSTEQVGEDELVVDAFEVTDSILPLNLTKKIGSVAQLLFGALLARTGRAALPVENPTLFTALGNLGIKISREDDFVILEGQVQGGDVVLSGKNRLDTLAVILAAVSGRGVSTIRNAAQEPEVDDTLELLTKMGAQVARTEPDEIVVEGVLLDQLSGAKHEVIYDRDQAVVEICRALSEGEEIQIENVEPKHFTAFLSKLNTAGALYKINDDALRVWQEEPLKTVELNPKPFPGFEPQWVGSFKRMIKKHVTVNN